MMQQLACTMPVRRVAPAPTQCAATRTHNPAPTTQHPQPSTHNPAPTTQHPQPSTPAAACGSQVRAAGVHARQEGGGIWPVAVPHRHAPIHTHGEARCVRRGRRLEREGSARKGQPGPMWRRGDQGGERGAAAQQPLPCGQAAPRSSPALRAGPYGSAGQRRLFACSVRPATCLTVRACWVQVDRHDPQHTSIRHISDVQLREWRSALQPVLSSGCRWQPRPLCSRGAAGHRARRLSQPQGGSERVARTPSLRHCGCGCPTHPPPLARVPLQSCWPPHPRRACSSCRRC
jgi:hypothetical protein